MGERLPPIGFWSYARQDDEEKLSQLRVRLSRQLQQQYGRNQIKIFQDVAAIPPGAEWETKILDALNTSTFFIPIITPNFLESEWCNKEFFIFREREKKLVKDYPELAGHRRIFPIYYVDIEGVKPHDPALLGELKRLQWLDFQDLIYKDDSREEVQSRLGELARSLRQLLHLEISAAEPMPGVPDSHDDPPPATSHAPPQPASAAPGSFWGRLTTAGKAAVAGGAAGLLAVVLLGVVLGTRSHGISPPKTPPAIAAPGDKETLADPRLAAANLMLGRWGNQNAPGGCDRNVSEITLAAQAGPNGEPRLELKKNGAIGALNADGFWVMDSGLWRYRNGALEVRAEGSPSDKFNLLTKCPAKDSAS